MLGKRRDEDKVNRYIRQRIRAARNEREMSQQELATHLQKSRVAVSDLERGRVQVNAADLSFIANALDKPISYFYPPPIRGAQEEGLTADEQELIHWFRKIWHKALQLVAIDQVRTLAESSIEADLETMRRETQDVSQRNDL